MKLNFSQILIIILVLIIAGLIVFDKDDTSLIDEREKQIEKIKLEKEAAIERAKFISDSVKTENTKRDEYWAEKERIFNENIQKEREEKERYRKELAKSNKRIKEFKNRIEDLEKNPPKDDPIDLVKGLQKDLK